MRNVKKVICELCGQEISKSNYTKHLRRHEVHPETFEAPTYKLNHDGLDCQFCGKTCKNRNSLCNHERLCKENPNRQLSEFCNFNKLKRVGKVKPWNKGLTKETDERVRKGVETYRRSFIEGKIKVRRGDENPSRRDEVRKKISETCLNKSKQGLWHTSLAKEHHYNYKGIDLHGTWELEYAKYLDSINIKWERCKNRFEYVFEDSVHYYTPDFYLPDSDEYIEIKGFAKPKDIEKWTQFPKDKTLKVLFGKDLVKLGLKIQL